MFLFFYRHFLPPFHLLQENIKKFNKSEYDKKYRKTHKVQLSVDLNPEEKIELINLIKAQKKAPVDF